MLVRRDSTFGAIGELAAMAKAHVAVVGTGAATFATDFAERKGSRETGDGDALLFGRGSGTGTLAGGAVDIVLGVVVECSALMQRRGYFLLLVCCGK